MDYECFFYILNIRSDQMKMCQKVLTRKIFVDRPQILNSFSYHNYKAPQMFYTLGKRFFIYRFICIFKLFASYIYHNYLVKL